jgi:hypothetical protein
LYRYNAETQQDGRTASVSASSSSSSLPPMSLQSPLGLPSGVEDGVVQGRIVIFCTVGPYKLKI